MTDQLLTVAACSGPRCRAVRGLTLGDSGTPRRLCRAVAARPDAALVSTGCLGACHLASVVLVGPAHYAGDGRLNWIGRPALVPIAEQGDRLSRLADWIAGTGAVR